jgi:hypothetical protein
MELRDKLRERAQKLLEPDEEIQEVFLALSGPNPNLLVMFGLVPFVSSNWVVAATDRNLVLMSAGRWSSSFPKEVSQRLPRDTEIGRPTGSMFLATKLPGDKTTWVHRRWSKDVEAADAARTSAAPPAAPSDA